MKTEISTLHRSVETDLLRPFLTARILKKFFGKIPRT
jgi:hypothetical protein